MEHKFLVLILILFFSLKILVFLASLHLQLLNTCSVCHIEKIVLE